MLQIGEVKIDLVIWGLCGMPSQSVFIPHIIVLYTGKQKKSSKLAENV